MQLRVWSVGTATYTRHVQEIGAAERGVKLHAQSTQSMFNGEYVYIVVSLPGKGTNIYKMANIDT